MENAHAEHNALDIAREIEEAVNYCRSAWATLRPVSACVRILELVRGSVAGIRRYSESGCIFIALQHLNVEEKLSDIHYFRWRGEKSRSQPCPRDARVFRETRTLWCLRAVLAAVWWAIGIQGTLLVRPNNCEKSLKSGNNSYGGNLSAELGSWMGLINILELFI